MGESVDLLDGARCLEGWWGSEGGWQAGWWEASSAETVEPVKLKRI